jgi:hypothetical protein
MDDVRLQGTPEVVNQFRAEGGVVQEVDVKPG